MSSRAATTTWALAGACHPLPSVAVTAFGTTLAAAAGNSPATCATVAVAVLAGQLSVGWSNDRIDLDLDRSSGRSDKPLAAGAVTLGAVDRAIAAAVAATVAGSLALGWRAGLLHLVAVAWAWLYNLGLKGTPLSWLPYAVAFGSTPAIATLSLPQPAAPAAWAVGAGALLGAGAHFANALPDLAADRDFGVLGLPHRIGFRASVATAGAALLAGTAVLVLGPAGPPSGIGWAGFGAATGTVALAVGASTRREPSPVLFLGTLAVAALDVALLLLGPTFVR